MLLSKGYACYIIQGKSYNHISENIFGSIDHSGGGHAVHWNITRDCISRVVEVITSERPGFRKKSMLKSFFSKEF